MSQSEINSSSSEPLRTSDNPAIPAEPARICPNSMGCFRILLTTVVIVIAGWYAGLPALSGEYLAGGDDEQLIFNHALVSQPSLKHAEKLFLEPIHRIYISRFRS